MQIEARELRFADVVRLAGDGEREIRKIDTNGAVRVWFRGEEEQDEPSREFALGEVIEIQRPGDLFEADEALDIARVKQAWAEYVQRLEGGTGWTPIVGTSCFQHDADDSLTLCTTYQRKAIGSCPPSMAGHESANKQLMLCQPGEEPEFFRGFEAGILEAKAEASNRVARTRNRGAAELPTIDSLPDPLDFGAQAALLAALVPSGIVYRKDAPLEAIPVSLAPPLIITPDGYATPSSHWHKSRPIPPGSVLTPAVAAPSDMRLVKFIQQLEGELVPYRGPIGPDTVQLLSNLARSSSLAKQLRESNTTLADFRSATIHGRTLYWVATPDGKIAVGPVTATGKVVAPRKVLAAISEQAKFGLPLAELPEGWSLADSLIVAVLRQGEPMWWIWNPQSHEFRIKRGDNDEWSKPKILPATSTPDPNKGYSDFPRMAQHTLDRLLDEAPRGVVFRVAGRWLGYLFPTDFNNRIRFDEPTGGELDLDAIEREHAEATEALAEADTLGRREQASRARRRLRWARKRLADEAKAKAKLEREAAKREAKAKRQRERAEAKQAKREEKADMSKKKKSTKNKAASKKATAKKAASKKTASKKATAKKATAKKATAKKATAKKPPTTPASSSAATKPAATKPAATKPAATKAPSARSLRFKRNDIVRFRKRSQIAEGLGVGLDKEFKVEMVRRREGRPMVVLRVGSGKHSALIEVPPGHLAFIERGLDVPPEIQACAAKLARFDGPITPTTRRLLAALARRA